MEVVEWAKLSALSAHATGPDTLFDEIAALGVDYGFERSVKFFQGGINPNRGLLTLHSKAFGTRRLDRLLRILGKLHAPKYVIAEIAEGLEAADLVHFGCEYEKDGWRFKVYLEFASKFREACAVNPPPSDEVLAYLAYKWKPAANDLPIITRYFGHSELDAKAIRSRIIQAFTTRTGRRIAHLIEEIVETALGQTPAEGLMYMSVREDGNQRVSFDLNFYRTGLRVFDTLEPLEEVAEHLAIPESQWLAFEKRNQDSRLGHLSGGVGRDGLEFLTVYFGVRGILPGDRPADFGE
jgi:hypothetical protein